jgi:hypothetical protein
MAGHMSSALIIIGFLLLLDSFVTIQNMFTGATATFTNGFELLLGLAVIVIGFKIREMKA